MPEKPIKFGKYTLGETLGTGGFGTVYKASDPSGRTVAIKVLKPGWNDDPGAIERFRREAQVAGELFHSRIATIIDFDEADGRLYLVMRYIDGIPLNELIKQKGRLSWEETIQILEQVAEGLDYAHQRELIHRDIKPANILISEKDGAVITDFGLVKAADVSGMSTSGVMLGTPPYIAPEIWEGKPATPATDIYSLACVAYEMLTGQVLFAGASPPEIMAKHFHKAPNLSEHWPQDMPVSIQKIFIHALQLDAIKRYKSTKDFMVDLKNSVARSGMDTPNKNGYFSSQSVQKLNGQNKPLVWLFISLILFVCLVGMFGITSLGGFLLSQNKTEPLNMSQTAQETQIPTFTNSDLSSIRTKTPTLQATHTNVSTLTDAPTQGQITQQLEQCNSNLPDTTCYHSYRVLSGQLLIVFFVKSLEQDNIPYAVLGGHKLKCILSTQFTDGFISCSSMNVVPAGKWDVSLFTKEDELISTGFISLASAGSTFTPTKKTSSNDSIYPTDLPTTETPPTDITETPPTDTPPTVPPTVPPTSPPTNPPPTNPPTSPPPTNPPPTATPKP